MSIDLSSGTCVVMPDDRLSPGGGAAQADSETTYGCRGECPSQGSQVHVIAQTQENYQSQYGTLPEVLADFD